MTLGRSLFRLAQPPLCLALLPLLLPVPPAAAADAAFPGERPAGEISRPALALSAAADPRSVTGIAIPRDLPSALDELDRLLPPGLRADLAAAPREEHARRSPELGRWIRSNWGLYQNSPLAAWFENIGVLSPDDMAGIVLLGLWWRLQGAPFEVEQLLASYGIRTLEAASLPAVEFGAGKKAETAYRFEGTGFSLDLPPRMRARVQNGGAGNGFSMAYFYGSGSGKQLLAAYAGPHPSFPAGVPARTRIRKGTFAGLPAEL